MRLEAERLLVQAEEDLVTATVLLKEERFYAAAFFAHQAAEILEWAKAEISTS